MKNVLITGGNGYFGRSIYKGLSRYHTITSVNRRDVDLTHAGSLKRFFRDRYFDVIIHCAVVGGNRLRKESWKDCDENLMMYYNLLQYKDYFGKMIHFGSGAELYYSDTPYGFSKTVIRNSILHTKDFYNLRAFGVFDENELDTRFIKANINRYINKEPLSIHKDRKMDMFYMEDLLKLVNHYICNDDLPKEVDCMYQQTSALSGIAHMINELSDHRCEITLESAEFDIDYKGKYIDIGLNFVGLEEGIKRTYLALNKKNP